MTKDTLKFLIALEFPKRYDMLEMRFFIPTQNDIVYMQVGSGDQLDGDCDENGVPYDAYIDYSISRWDESSNFFTEYDGGIFEFVSNENEDFLGILKSRSYDTLVEIYGKETVEDENFIVQVLKESN